MIPFKFFKGKVFTDEFTLPRPRRMSGRTIAQESLFRINTTVSVHTSNRNDIIWENDDRIQEAGEIFSQQADITIRI